MPDAEDDTEGGELTPFEETASPENDDSTAPQDEMLPESEIAMVMESRDDPSNANANVDPTDAN